MAIYDNRRLVIKACQLFYEENKSQKEISNLLGISKPQICRMLNYAKENHLVEFVIHNPYTQEFEAEKGLISRYHLSNAFIFDLSSSSSLEIFDKLGECFFTQFEQYLMDNTTIGVMSGRSIGGIANNAHRLNRSNLLFVPLVGGQGGDGSDFQANVIAQTFAKKTGGNYRLLNAPILVQNEEIRNLLCHEPSIAETLEKGKKVDLALLGIGDISDSSSACLNGYFGDKDIPPLLNNGAVASVCTSFLDSNGSLIPTPLNKRSIGITLPDMKNCLTIGVAAGSEKLNAVHAALLSGYLDILVTTLDFSRQLLEIS